MYASTALASAEPRAIRETDPEQPLLPLATAYDNRKNGEAKEPRQPRAPLPDKIIPQSAESSAELTPQ